MSFISYALPLTGDEEIAEVIDTIKTGWLTKGPKIKRCENNFSEFVGAK